MPNDPPPVRAYAVLRDGTINLGDIHETRQIAEIEHAACAQPERHEVVEVVVGPYQELALVPRAELAIIRKFISDASTLDYGEDRVLTWCAFTAARIEEWLAVAPAQAAPCGEGG